MRLALVLLLAAVSASAFACSSEDRVEPSERAAAEMVNAHLSEAPKHYITPWATLNLDRHEGDCTIGEGSTTGVEPMAAKCEWSVREINADNIRVELVEKWKCSDFNERAGREDFCQKDEGRHRWAWQITEGTVVYLDELGDPAPESFYLPAN